MPVVMVEIAPPDPPAALAEALLDACSAAVRVGQCVVDDGRAPGEPVAVAVVRWEDPEGSRVRVEVGVRNAGEPAWSSRNLQFGPADPPVERWRTAGLTIATLAGEMVAGAERAKAEVRSSPGASPQPRGSNDRRADSGPTNSATASESPIASRRETWWVGAVASVGPGLDRGPFRVGGSADVGWKPTRQPFFPRLSVGFAARPADSRGLAVQWETATLGVGGIIGAGPVELEPVVSFGVDVVHAGVTDAISRREDSGTQLGFGFHGGADAVFRVGRVGFLARIDAWHLAAATNVLVKDERVGVSPANGWALGVGFRFFVE